MPHTSRFRAAEAIVHVLRRAGHEAYFAGGSVRDLLLDRTPDDYDVATSATPDIVLDLFPRTFAVGAHFGVVIVADEVDGESLHTEVATFRADGAYTDGRRPDTVRYTASASEDVHRRDFTINGLLLDPDQPDAPIDYVGGLVDLASKTIRAIGDPGARFAEDHLRMLRAVRFAARFHFTIEPATFGAIREYASSIATVSRERVRDELTRMLTEGSARRAFELLRDTTLLKYVLPEVARMIGVEQPPQFHPEGDVFTHTLLLLEQLNADAPMTLAWGALLHDIGKPATFERAADRIRFNNHAEVGTAIAAVICRRLRFSNDEAEQILSLVQNHMRFGDVEKMKASTLKRFFRLPDFPQHLALHRMDALAASGNLGNWQYAHDQFYSMPPEEVRPQLLLTGRDLIAAGYEPGANFRLMLSTLEDAQLEQRITTREEAMTLLLTQFPLGATEQRSL